MTDKNNIENSDDNEFDLDDLIADSQGEEINLNDIDSGDTEKKGLSFSDIIAEEDDIEMTPIDDSLEINEEVDYSTMITQFGSYAGVEDKSVSGIKEITIDMDDVDQTDDSESDTSTGIDNLIIGESLDSTSDSSSSILSSMNSDDVTDSSDEFSAKSMNVLDIESNFDLTLSDLGDEASDVESNLVASESLQNNLPTSFGNPDEAFEFDISTVSSEPEETDDLLADTGLLQSVDEDEPLDIGELFDIDEPVEMDATEDSSGGNEVPAPVVAEGLIDMDEEFEFDVLAESPEMKKDTSDASVADTGIVAEVEEDEPLELGETFDIDEQEESTEKYLSMESMGLEESSEPVEMVEDIVSLGTIELTDSTGYEETLSAVDTSEEDVLPEKEEFEFNQSSDDDSFTLDENDLNGDSLDMSGRTDSDDALFDLDDIDNEPLLQDLDLEPTSEEMDLSPISEVQKDDDPEDDIFGLGGLGGDSSTFEAVEVLLEGVEMSFEDQVRDVTHAEILLSQGKKEEAAALFRKVAENKGATFWVKKRLDQLNPK